jgi:hypothetical protein
MSNFVRHLFEDVIPTHDDSHHIIQRWQQEKIVYASPGGANDDWFWLYAAVVLRCHIVSNDEMRDHHFLMLSPRLVVVHNVKSCSNLMCFTGGLVDGKKDIKFISLSVRGISNQIPISAMITTMPIMMSQGFNRLPLRKVFIRHLLQGIKS